MAGQLQSLVASCRSWCGNWSHGRTAMVAFGFTLILAVWVLAIFQVKTERSQKEADLAVQISNLALSFEHSMSRTVNTVDTLVKFIRQRYTMSDGAITWASLIREDIQLDKVTAQIGVADSGGFSIVSTNVPMGSREISIADADHFKVHRSAREDFLYVSRPVIGRFSGKRRVQLTRGIRSREGSFQGVIVASLDPDEIVRHYSDLVLGRTGGVALIGADGIIRAGTGSFASGLGSGFREGRLIEHVPLNDGLPQFATSNLFREVFDGETRLIATRRIAGLPMEVVVALGDDALYAGIEAKSRFWYMLAALGSLLVLAAIAVIIWYEQQTIRSLDQRRTMEVEKKVAEAAAADRGLFLAVMSHEIRTPLNGVLGALDLLRSSNLDERSKRCVGMAADAGETLLHLIDDVLLFSKAENGKIDVAKEPMILTNVIDDIRRSMLALTAVSKNTLVTRVCAEASLPILGDARRLRQILVNLIGNANKFTINGHIALSVETLAKTDDNLTLRISVSDTGIGIPKDKQALIFNRFQTLDPSYTRRTDGTGLGLAICDKLVRAMGGEINVDSDFGKGSRFSFDLVYAFARDMPAQAAGGEATGDAPQEAPQAAPSLRILLAEDNQTNTFVATNLLTDAGHRVYHACNGKEAVEMASQMPFDVILMDISMPEMNGIEATARIRSSSAANTNTPIIALTAHAVSGDRERFLEAKMDGYISKPIRKDVLLSVVKSDRVTVETPLAAGLNDSDAAPIIDMAVLMPFLGERTVDRSLKTLQIFVTELEEKAVALCGIIAARDIKGLQALAHSVLGSGTMLGASRLVAISSLIEKRCTDRMMIDWRKAEKLLSIIRETVVGYSAFAKEEELSKLALQREIAA